MRKAGPRPNKFFFRPVGPQFGLKIRGGGEGGEGGGGAMYNSKRTILQDLRFNKRGSKPDTKMRQRQENVSYNGNICYIRVLIHNYTMQTWSQRCHSLYQGMLYRGYTLVDSIT